MENMDFIDPSIHFLHIPVTHPTIAGSTRARHSPFSPPHSCAHVRRWLISDPLPPTFGFTLIELMVVIAIIVILMALLAPAFTSVKSAGDVTSAAYTVKGVLDQARTYAQANNTYTWVGFFEENVSNPSPNSATPKIGRIVMSIVASKDGTIVYDANNPAKISTTKLIQVGKLTKIENAHLWTHTDTPSGTGSTFDTRP